MILWEAFVSYRPVLFTTHLNTSLEWQHPCPPAEHRYGELVYITA